MWVGAGAGAGVGVGVWVGVGVGVGVCGWVGGWVGCRFRLAFARSLQMVSAALGCLRRIIIAKAFDF